MLLCAVLLAAIPNGLFVDEEPLVLSPREGAPVHLEVTHRVDNETQAMGMKLDTVIEIREEITLELLEAPAEAPLLVELRFGRVRGKIQAPIVGKIEFDSAEPKDSHPQIFEAKVREFLMRSGKAVQLQVTSRGRVLDVDGFEEIYAGTNVGDVLAKEGTVLTNESFVQDAQLYFPPLPAEAPAELLHWQSDSPMTVFEHTIDLAPRFEIEELAKTKATITFLGRHKPEEEVKAAEASDKREDAGEALLAGRTRITSASLQGSYVVARADGLPQTAEITRIVAVDVPNPFGGDPLPTYTKQSTVVKRLAVKEKPQN